jgi:hypothetical protein
MADQRSDSAWWIASFALALVLAAIALLVPAVDWVAATLLALGIGLAILAVLLTPLAKHRLSASFRRRTGAVLIPLAMSRAFLFALALKGPTAYLLASEPPEPGPSSPDPVAEFQRSPIYIKREDWNLNLSAGERFDIGSCGARDPEPCFSIVYRRMIASAATTEAELVLLSTAGVGMDIAGGVGPTILIPLVRGCRVFIDRGDLRLTLIVIDETARRPRMGVGLSELRPQIDGLAMYRDGCGEPEVSLR